MARPNTTRRFGDGTGVSFSCRGLHDADTFDRSKLTQVATVNTALYVLSRLLDQGHVDIKDLTPLKLTISNGLLRDLV